MNEVVSQDENFYVFRAQWLDYLVTRRDLTHADFRVAYFIAKNINGRDKCMWWAVKTIASELGVSIVTVTDATYRLSDKRLLVIARRAKGAYSYSMRMPFDPDADAWAAEPERKKKTGGRKARVSDTETGRVSKTET